MQWAVNTSSWHWDHEEWNNLDALWSDCVEQWLHSGCYMARVQVGCFRMFHGTLWFYCNGQADIQEWLLEHFTDEIPLHDIQIGVWCVLSVGSVSGPVFCADTVNVERQASGPVSFILPSCCSHTVTAADSVHVKSYPINHRSSKKIFWSITN
jgi:hypothetical protein